MRAMDDEPFQKNTSQDLAEDRILNLNKEMEEERTEPVGVRIGITEMKDHRV